MEADTKSVSDLITYMKIIEDEIREIRQRLEDVERTVVMRKWSGTSSTHSNVHIQKIDSVARKLVDTIELSKLREKTEPLKLLAQPEVPIAIIEMKAVLTQLDVD